MKISIIIISQDEKNASFIFFCQRFFMVLGKNLAEKSYEIVFEEREGLLINHSSDSTNGCCFQVSVCFIIIEKDEKETRE